MELTFPYKQALQQEGYAIIDNVFNEEEVAGIVEAINNIDTSGTAFRKTSDLYAIRRFIKEVPAMAPLLFNSRMQAIIDQLFGNDYSLVKSIYFDKPGQSNWFVAYHQDLTISADQKMQLEGYEQWTVKNDQFAVQPPLSLLENIFTIRIHLDDTDENNGALKIVPGSHRKGIYRPETIDWSREKEVICKVPRGGVMIMQPLLLHASNRTVNNNKRRVIHLEFSNQQLPNGLQWAEYLAVNNFPASA
ncbi:phytanoyl-CoA dioxygenase [Niastella vici]|uniref:Phytanoyl-CoA dioxygenase n=1 Tax=Niastella vici TaxID=1703345 RepID=A0A1V9G5Q3_9BACT|nr:phytanoyl-CoA dioxygenase family protein [Niastella vici]OQP65971.1 phytanoyl-CoA dioxygenase [Niastella vici]